MKLIEKKCPNCGASLEFDDQAKSCKCSYCHRSFEIERNQDNLEEIELIFSKTPKFFLIPFILIFVSVITIFVFVFIGISSYDTFQDEEILDIFDMEDVLLSDLSSIQNSDFRFIDSQGTSIITNLTFGYHEYQREGRIERVKTFLAYQEDENILIPIYQVNYASWPEKTEKYTVYIPILFEDVMISDKNINIHELSSGKTTTNQYYFGNSGFSIPAYDSLESLEQDFILPLEEEYIVTQK